MSALISSNPVQEYLLDAWQRSILCLDILRERGNTYFDRTTLEAPNVLAFEFELIRDGRLLPRPVNYMLVRILPPNAVEGSEVETDPVKPPIIVVDPRAGHGPGIGGMKQDSEIGVALAAGHPCYFIGFLPTPVPGQTIEDVCRAEAAFVEEVAARHPDTDGKPIIIANCQAGWQIAMMAAIRPDLVGPILLAGSPLSYWQGQRGKNPMRYLGGMLGGTWLTALSGDLGAGIFDGAHLVENFESLNPANTHWQKFYNVYSKADTEEQRFLDFETWWGSPVLLNSEEMQWIADNLFVGNKLTAGAIRTSDGQRVDLRHIKSPIVVFCSWGDNITPPPQALGWITDLYAKDEDICTTGQTIVYCLHQSIGHLGIFVSGKIANKEHDEFVNCMDMIDMMPPGLYEAIIDDIDDNTVNPDLVGGRHLFKLKRRKLDDIRALCGTDNDDRAFATVARVSESNHSLYETFLSPALRAAATPQMAAAMRSMHPNRLRFGMFSDQNPLMQPVQKLAESVRETRQPVAPNNPFLTMESMISSWIGFSWDSYQQMRDLATEAMFLNTYGSPVLQAMVGLGPQTPTGRLAGRDLLCVAAQNDLRARVESKLESGGIPAAFMRAIMYARAPEGGVDEREFAVLRSIRAAPSGYKRLSWAEAKELIRDQYVLLQIEEERAIAAIPAMLPKAKTERRAILDAVYRVVLASGTLSPASAVRLARIDHLFGFAPADKSKARAPEAEEGASEAEEEEAAHA